MNERATVRDRLEIAGVGKTPPVRDDPRSIPEMVLFAVEAALRDAGIGFEAVDAVTTASVDLFDGLTASNIAITEVVGAVMKPETRIAGDGLCAVVHAAAQVWSGAYDTVLVVAHGKGSMVTPDAVSRWAMDPIALQPLGVDDAVCAGLVAQARAAGDPATRRRWARRVVTRRAAAPASGGAVPLTVDAVLSAPMVADPITELMCAPVADQACAVVVRRLDEHRASRPRPTIVVRGVGHDIGPHGLADPQFARWNGLSRAVGRACAVAGLDPSRDAFHLLEPSCRYPHEEDQFVEALDVVDPGRLSPSGGLFAGAAPVAAGLSRLVAAAMDMRSNPALGWALAHGTWGPAGQGQVVTILEAAA